MTKPPADAGIDLDAILLELGQFGRYQIQTYCFILLPIVFSAVYRSHFVFTAAAVDYRCQVPECESAPLQWNPGQWGEWALQEDTRCERWQPISDVCEPDTFHSNVSKRCNAFVYENNNTIVSTFDLACHEWKRTLVGTIHSAGLLTGLPIVGYMSDTFGRRFTFILSAVSVALMGLIRSFSTNYIVYLSFEYLSSIVGSGVYSTGFILALEMVGFDRRVIGGNIISSSFAMGQVLLALVAWGVPYWRTLTRIVYVPSFLFVFYYFFVEESVRWLLSKGNKKEASRIIYKAAAINKKKLSPETIQKLEQDSPPLVEVKKPTDGKATPEIVEKKRSLFREVIRSRVIMSRLFICSFWWITLTFIYYGLSFNSVSLAGNMYVNYILTSLVEIPGSFISMLTLDRFGRKSSIMTAYFVCGAALIALPFIPSDLQWLITSLSLLGKLSISMAFSSIYIYTSELFPTQARHRLFAFCSMMGRIGSLVAPQTPLLMAYMESLPYLIFGVMAGISGMLMLLTPETLRMRLPDTVAQAESIAAEEYSSSYVAEGVRSNAKSQIPSELNS